MSVVRCRQNTQESRKSKTGQNILHFPKNGFCCNDLECPALHSKNAVENVVRNAAVKTTYETESSEQKKRMNNPSHFFQNWFLS